MKIPGRVFSTFLIIFFISWSGGDHAAISQSVTGESTMQVIAPAKISLVFTPMTDPVSTFVTIKPDNQAKVVRYSRYLLDVKSLWEGNLSQQELSKLLDKAQAPAFANADCTKSFGSPGPAHGDQFHLTINIEQKQKECSGLVADTPPAIRSLVEDLLSTGQQLSAAPLGDAYLRSEPISQNRYEALRKSTRLRFTNLEEFPSGVRQILSMAINNPRDFFVLSMDQRKNLQDRITNGQELFVTHKTSGHQITIFLAQK